MTVQPIEYGDNGRVAREKINAMLQEVDEHIPSIWENNHWYLWETDTGIEATWPKGEDWEPWKDWKPWPQWEPWPQGEPWEPWKDGKTPVKWVDYFTQEDIDSLKIPKKVSNLENDTGFITKLVEDLVNYYKKSELYTQAEIDELLGNIVWIKVEVVETLPQKWQNGVIYFVPNGWSGENIYDEYIRLESKNRFDLIWTTKIDLSDYYTKDETDELLDEKADRTDVEGVVKFWDNSPDNIYISAYDENWNWFEFDSSSIYVENEDGDAESYDFFGDYRIARLNETMRWFPIPERWDDISNILEILKRNKPVYFYEKRGETYNIWVVQSFVTQTIKSYMNNKGEWVNDNWWECDGHTVANADLVYQQTYTWRYLPSNNTWDWSAFSQYRETSSSFTVNGNWLFRMWFEYKLKVKNTWQSTITVTLWNKLLNPRNIPTTVAKWKEVIFLFYSSHSTMATMELAQRIERPIGEDMSNYYNKSEVDSLLDEKADSSDLDSKADKSELPDMSNYYNKTSVDGLLSNKADASDLNNKADKSNTYTKAETDSLLDGKADSSELNDKADKSNTYTKAEVDSKIDDIDLTDYYKKSETYSKTEVDNSLTNKADKSDVYTKTETDWLLDDKADKSDTYSKTEVDGLLDDKADKSELPSLTTQTQQTPWQPITALVKDWENEVRFDVAGDTVQMDFTNENGSNTKFLSTNDYVDEKTEQATEDTLGTVKLNPNKAITLNNDWQLEVWGRMWQFEGTTWLFAPNNRDPRKVADYSLLMTDALWVNMTANRSLAIVSGYWVTCQSAPAGSTVYKLANTYINRLKAKCCEWWFIALNEQTSKAERIVPVTSVLIWGNTFHPNSVPNSSTPIEITVSETVNPYLPTTSIRLFGTMNSYASLHIWNWVSSGWSGRSLMIGWGITKKDGNDNCMVWMDMYATGNGNAMFWRYHIARKNRWFLAGTGHDTTNARTEWASAVWEYSSIDANTLFAVGNGTSHTARSNAFEVTSDGGIVLKSPNWTRWKITVDNSGNLTTTAV